MQQTHRRARHSMSLLHTHLVFVTKYRRKVVTDTMLTFCEHSMRAVCAELDATLAESNHEADRMHLLVAYPPILAISALVQRLKGRTTLTVQCAYCTRRHTRWPNPRLKSEACSQTNWCRGH